MPANLRARPSNRPARRSGSLTVELLLIAPVLIAVIAAAVEIGLLFAATHRLEAASAVGARVAAQGGNDDDVARAVYDFLGNGALQEAEVCMVLLDEDRKPLSPGSFVDVIVKVKAGRVVPDLLSFIGLSIKDRTLSGHTRLRKE